MPEKKGKAKEKFNRGAIPVLREEKKTFLEKLGDNMCAVAVRYDYGKAADRAAISKALDAMGGHVVKHHPSEFGDVVYVWTGAGGIRALEKLPEVRLVTPYRNWNDPHKVPVSEFKKL